MVQTAHSVAFSSVFGIFLILLSWMICRVEKMLVRSVASLLVALLILRASKPVSGELKHTKQWLAV